MRGAVKKATYGRNKVFEISRLNEEGIGTGCKYIVAVVRLDHSREKYDRSSAASFAESPAKPHTVEAGHPDVEDVKVEFGPGVLVKGLGAILGSSDLPRGVGIQQHYFQHLASIAIIFNAKNFHGEQSANGG
jgi:hypothetical protein